MVPGRRLVFLDSLRAIAAIGVVVQHLFEHTILNQAFMIVSPGLFGVVLFFLISGFIIPYSVGAHFNADKFVINRVFRIFPAFLAVLFLTLLLGWSGLAGWSAAVTGPEKDMLWLVGNMLTVAEYVGRQPLIGVAWTLPIEFFWYATFALLFAAYGRRFALRLTIGLSVLLLAVSILAVQWGVRVPVGRLSLVNAASVGYLFYLYHLEQLNRRGLALGVAAFALMTPVAFAVTYLTYPHPNVQLGNMLLTWATALAFFSAVMLSKRLRDSRLLTAAPMRGLGEISYSLYLIHGLIIGLMMDVGVAFAMVVLLSLPLTAIASWLMYRHVERPGMALGKRIFHSMQTRDVEVLGFLFRKLGLIAERREAS